MKIYNVSYVHVWDKGVHIDVQPFLDMEDAAKCYEKKRALAVEVARDDDPDSDEEVFRDLRIRESQYHFICRVPEDGEFFDVRLSQSEAG